MIRVGWMELVVAIVGTGVVSTGLTLWFGRRKAAVDAEVTLSGGYGDLVNELRKERAELRAERAELRTELRTAHADNQAAHLESQSMRLEMGELRTELRAVKADLGRVMAGQAPLTDWTNRP